jgi:hypothetical protein
MIHMKQNQWPHSENSNIHIIIKLNVAIFPTLPTSTRPYTQKRFSN